MLNGQSEPSFILKAKIDIPYHWQAGDFLARFFTGLRNGILLASVCPKCNLKSLPPRRICKKCFVSVTEWMEVANGGTLISFSGIPTDRSKWWGMVRFDGCNTEFIHFVNSERSGSLRIGERMKAVFRPPNERTGTILDILHFDIAS